VVPFLHLWWGYKMSQILEAVPSQISNSINASLTTGVNVFGTGQIALFFHSTVFIPTTTTIRVRVKAHGGTGAMFNGAGSRATGGAGGGFAMGVYTVVPGVPLVVTIGPRPSQPGMAGGSVSLSNLISASGGMGGKSAASGAVEGAIGGVGVGGNLINADGGKSGSIVATATGTCATGGGAPGSIFGPGGNGGNITGVGSASCATGGGAVNGFKGGDLDCSSGTILVSGGAGTAGNAVGILGGMDYLGVASAGVGADNAHIQFVRFATEFLRGGGGAGRSDGNGYNGGPGAGGGAAAGTSAVRAGNGGICGAGAAAIATLNFGYSGAGGFGAGSGAVAGVNGGSVGESGAGFIMIEF
jgi:hypothetical protein